MKDSRLRVKLIVSGIVQGVGFRPFIYRIAVRNGLAGYVRNMGDAGVEIVLEGAEVAIEEFTAVLYAEKPPLAQIYNLTRAELSGENQYRNFTITQSSQTAELSGSVIPPDIAICNTCLKELRDPKNTRHNYFFITCTDCGPRFTIIEHLPYDRDNTTVRDFPLCRFCQGEYEDPANRRFHAETVADPTCGPKAYLTNSHGDPIETADPVRLAGKLLSEGKILAVKGYGGFHIAASTMLEEPLLQLRETKHRKEKPFAVMARSLEAAESFAYINAKERELLTSPQRPIVLLNKNPQYQLSALVAPNLHNIGVMLPYTALHYMLFDQITDQGFVMTSANPANQPIVNDNAEALKILGETVDYFLFHNRRIAHRCDDSVMRVHGTRQVFIRRSRGYAPVPIRLKSKTDRCVVALGGELNDTATILTGNKAFITQHIGDVKNIETQTFLQKAIHHLQHLTNCQPSMVACDLHPKFNTTHLAQEMAETSGLELVQVQHHHAHAAALMAEHELDEVLAVACDGYGYGLGSEAWGGEVLLCKSDRRGFERLGHLELQPLLGGDLASRYPLRMAAGMLHKAGVNVYPWLLQNSMCLQHGDLEANLLAQQLRSGTSAMLTSSCGRVLDAAAAVLGICFQRTYEGEPAMKLESAALQGKDTLKLEPKISGGILDTTFLLSELYTNLKNYSPMDLAYSVHAYIAEGLAEIAVEKARQIGAKNVGFTGGAACNQLLVTLMRKTVEASRLCFFMHEQVPPGDGGVSFGQAVVASISNI